MNQTHKAHKLMPPLGHLSVLCASAAFILASSGCFGLSKNSDALDPFSAALKLSASQLTPLDSTSNLSRSQTEVIALRLNTIFPGFDRTLLTLGTGTGKALGQADFINTFHSMRSASTLAQNQLRATVAGLCKGTGAANLLFSTQNILLSSNSETLPADPAQLLAFSSARNGWLYPYAADSTEVTALTKLYNDVIAAGGSAAEARQNLCMAVLLTPQFWLGNNGKFETIRKIALDIGFRLPTFQEFGDFNSGALDVQTYLTRIQGEPGYLRAVRSWHREWLGIKDFSNYWGVRDPRGGKGHFAWYLATALGGQEADMLPYFGDSTHPMIRLLHSNYDFVDPEDAQNLGGLQTFDPNTTDLIWEQRLTSASAWIKIGSWHNNAGVWQMLQGDSFRVDGVTHTDPSDIRWAPYDGSVSKFRYHSGGLVGTPFETFTQGNLRVRRLSPSGEQNGFSKVTLWWSGQEVYVSNGLTRFVATCAYRAATADYLQGQIQAFDASIPSLMMQGASGTTLGVLSLAHPVILGAMKCGIPNPDSAVEATAFPSAAPYSQLVTNIKAASPTLTDTSGRSEYQAYQSIVQDLTSEPETLVEDIVSGNQDYRLLLTADYTWGRGPLELLYRTQDYFLPKYVGGNSAYTPSSSDYGVLHRIRPVSFANVTSSKWGTTSWGWSLGYSMFQTVALALDLSSPRPMSGVLTQAAFLAPAGMKMRANAARIFRTFTCNELNGYTVPSSSLALHTGYIPQNELTSGAHVDLKQNCFYCHINMDPLASALSSGFRALDTSGMNKIAPAGEMAYFDFYDVNAGATYGIRGVSVPSEGAVMGQKVSGVREVGQVLANSPEFSACAVRRAFEGIFGRSPAFEDSTLINTTSKRFMQENAYNYNLMVRDLVLSSTYQRRN